MSAQILQGEEDFLLWQSIFENPKGENVKSRGLEIEKRIEFLESLTGRVRNRKSQRWLNDRLLMELVPCLDAEEIRGLFSPPPWGDDVPVSPFCMTNIGEWDKFRVVDMDKEAAMIEALEGSPHKQKGRVDADKVAVLTAWHRVNCRTREALRRCFLSDMVKGYEEQLRKFIQESANGDFLVFHVQDPFHRLLLHGVCEFYDLISVTTSESASESKGRETLNVTTIRKKARVIELPNITLCNFLKMAKEGNW